MLRERTFLQIDSCKAGSKGPILLVLKSKESFYSAHAQKSPGGGDAGSATHSHKGSAGAVWRMSWDQKTVKARKPLLCYQPRQKPGEGCGLGGGR